MSKNPLTFIVGPTASGKSSLALELARQWQGAIVNADSVQVFQQLNIGTAKPTPEEQCEVTHYLFDLIPPGGAYTAGQYRKEALDLIEEKSPHQKLFFVGGSGFYIQALEKGMFDVGEVSSAIVTGLKERLEKEGLESLYSDLKSQDPHYAKKVSSEDTYRILRALGVMASQQQTMTEIKDKFLKSQQSLGEKYSMIKVGLSCRREKLRERVHSRVELMLEQGFVAEVEALIHQGYKDWTPLKSVGYKECVKWIEGAYSQESFVEEVVKNTMKLAKRQMTWFRRDPHIRWFDIENERELALQFVGERLA